MGKYYVLWVMVFICIFEFMKWLMILLSLYVLTLSAIPCSGDDACCGEIVSGKCATDHPGHHHSELPCSPFFSCNTCHGVVVPGFIPGLSTRIVVVRSFPFTYIPHSLPGFAVSIWQPPQIA